MPEQRGVRTKKSIRTNVEDDATREALRNIEERLIAIERRITPPIVALGNYFRVVNYSLGAATVNIINLSPMDLQFASVGGLVEVWLQPAINPTNLIPTFDVACTKTVQVTVKIIRDDDPGTTHDFPFAITGAAFTTGSGFTYPYGQVRYIDSPPAGNHVYRAYLYVFSLTGTITMSFGGFQLGAMEICPLR
jgi:hypothetical protein